MSKTGMMGGSLTVIVNGKRLKALREIRNLTQKEVEDALGMPSLRLSLSEQGKPTSIEYVMKFANYYGVSPKEIVEPESFTLNERLLNKLAAFHRKKLCTETTVA